MSELRRRLLMGQTLTWLYPATQAAIMAAFGNDGTAVITATNVYLSDIASTDPTKAQALAGYLNEDPMMVCSLGLQPQGVTMPIRWLVGDGNSWVDSGLKATPQTMAKSKILYKRTDGSGFDPFGVRTSQQDNKDAFYLAYDTRWTKVELRVINGGTFQYSVTLNSGVYDIELKPNTCKLNNSTYVTGTNIGSRYNIYAMTVRNGEAGTFSNKMRGEGMAFLLLKSTSGGDVNLIPFISTTREGMVDLVNATFHPNYGAGHFTDAYTSLDGTPWTHANKTP